MITLPLNIGDTVWVAILNDKFQDKTKARYIIFEAEVFRVDKHRKKNVIITKYSSATKYSKVNPDFDETDKHVFMTKNQAKNAIINRTDLIGEIVFLDPEAENELVKD